jgi:hypothetical protein
VPWMRKSGEGHAADTQIVQERAHALLATLQGSPSPRSLGAAAPLDPAEHAPTLAHLGFLPRLPGTLKRVAQGSTPARPWDTWPWLEAPTRSRRLSWCPYGMAQRWRGGWSQASLERAEARGKTAWQRAVAAVTTPRWHWPAQRCEPPSQAHQAWSEWAPQGRSHPVPSDERIDHTRSATQGRPLADTPSKASAWQRQAQGRPAPERLEEAKQHKAYVVRGTNSEAEPRSEAAVSTSDKGQAQGEGGCRGRKAPRFCVSSLVVKQPCRMQGLWRVMTLALRVSAVAPRRLRRE